VGLIAVAAKLRMYRVVTAAASLAVMLEAVGAPRKWG
jgi:hypothetical protein